MCRSLGVLFLFLAPPALAAGPAPLTLPQLIELVRKADPRVLSAEAEVRRYEALHKEARWAWFPKFETVVGVGGPTPESYNDGLGGLPSTPASYLYDAQLGNLGVSAAVESTALLPIYTFGKLKALERAGAQGPKVGAALRQRAQDEATLQAAQAFFGYQLAREGLVSIDETAKRLEDAATLVQRLLKEESPQVSQLDTFKVEFFRKQVAARKGLLVQGQALALEALRLLSGRSREEGLAIAEVALRPSEVASITLPAAMDCASRKRPELAGIAAGIQAREQEVLLKERMFLPDLGILGFFRAKRTTNTTIQRTPFAFDRYNDLTGGVALVARATFDIPVKQAQAEQSRAALDSLRHQARILGAGVELEVAQAHGRLAAAAERSQSLADAEKNARRWATAAYAAFEVGTGDSRELVDAFGALAQASGEKLQSWHDMQLGQFQLEKAMGSPLRSCE